MDWKKIITELGAAGMTQKQIADVCGVQQCSVSDLLRGVTKSPRFEFGSRLVELHLSRSAAQEDQIHSPS
jgi:predicted XRE-type DNA-binding protein